MPRQSREESNDVVDVVVIQSNPEDKGSDDDDDVIFVQEVLSSSTSTRPPNKKQRTRKTPQTNPLRLCPLSKPNKHCSRCRIDELVNQKTLHCHCASKIKLPKGRVEAAEDHWKSRTSNQ